MKRIDTQKCCEIQVFTRSRLQIETNVDSPIRTKRVKLYVLIG